MNEEKAIEYTIKVLDKIKKTESTQNIEIQIVQLASNLYYSDEFESSYITKNLDKSWILPKGIDIVAWKEFHKTASRKEICSLLWTHVIKFNVSNVIAGLEITEGTHYYRISSALKRLGIITLNY